MHLPIIRRLAMLATFRTTVKTLARDILKMPSAHNIKKTMPTNKPVLDLIYDRAQLVRGIKLLAETAFNDINDNHADRRDSQQISFIVELSARKKYFPKLPKYILYRYYFYFKTIDLFSSPNIVDMLFD
jgi:hypothetical protein